MLEKAFIESYRKLCDNNNDVIDEFIKELIKYYQKIVWNQSLRKQRTLIQI